MSECHYCNNDTKLLYDHKISNAAWCWGWEPDKKVTLAEAEKEQNEIAVILDERGYIRLVDPDDCQCLDHGQKVKINFCPMCGTKYINT